MTVKFYHIYVRFTMELKGYLIIFIDIKLQDTTISFPIFYALFINLIFILFIVIIKTIDTTANHILKWMSVLNIFVIKIIAKL